MMRSRSSKSPARIPSGPASISSTWGRSGSIKTITPTASARDCAVSCQTAPASIRSSYFSGLRPVMWTAVPASEDVGGHRVTHHPETDHPRRGSSFARLLRHGLSVTLESTERTLFNIVDL